MHVSTYNFAIQLPEANAYRFCSVLLNLLHIFLLQIDFRSADLLGRRPTLGCTDLVHLRLRELPGVGGKEPESVWGGPHVGRHGLGSPDAP